VKRESSKAHSSRELAGGVQNGWFLKAS